jgi:putative MFS transporter
MSQFIMFCAVPVVAFCGWAFITLHPFGADSWRAVAMIGSLGALAAWWLRRGVPESPRWLVLRGRGAEAEKILATLEEKIARDTGGALPPPAPAAAAPRTRGTLAEIFRTPYGGRTAMLSVFNLMQSIAFYGFGSWVPTLLIAKGIHVTTSLEYAFIIALANPLGPLLGFLVADRMERKWQLVTAGASVTLFVYLFARQSAPFAVILFGVAVTLANNWISFATHNYQSELYPTRIRARAVGFVYSWSRLSAALAGLLINFFLAKGGTLGVAFFIGAAMTVMVITIAAFGPRTRGRSLEEISN